jgi:hypothetical protein
LGLAGTSKASKLSTCTIPAIKTGDLERLGLAGGDPMLTADEVKSDKKARAELVERVRAGAHFTCFTSAQFTCFRRRARSLWSVCVQVLSLLAFLVQKVQILPQKLAETALVCGALLLSKLNLSVRIGLTKPVGKRESGRDGARVRSPHDGGHC